ncbi:MAG: tetratricopeptide repeat protein [Candidatus Puniceispirillaceae bacterium]
MTASVESQLKKSSKALSGNRFAEARDGFMRILQKFPQNARARRGFWVSQSAIADAGFAANHPPRQQLDAIAAALAAGDAAGAVSMAAPLSGTFPRAHGLHNLLGVAQAALNRDDEAIAAFRAAVDLKPNFLEARGNLASRLLARADFEGALQITGDSLEMAPDDAASLNAMTVCLIGLNRFEEAMATARRTIRAQPDHAEAHNNLGMCLRHLGQPEDAIESYRTALAIRPDLVDAALNLGLALVRSGRADEAVDSYLHHLDRMPGNARLHSHLGLAFTETRQFADAVAAFGRALEINPDQIDARFNRFIALALDGQLDRAWPDAECRFDSRRRVPVTYRYGGTAPRWDGKAPLAGKTLLVHAEQGLGDTLMFLRYLAVMPDRPARLHLAVQLPLVDLLATQDEALADITILPLEEGTAGSADGSDPPDLQCPMMSLPYLLGATGTPPAPPVLAAPEGHLSAWRDRLGEPARPRVGFMFRGNPNHVNEANRSIGVERFLHGLPPGCDYHFLGIDLTAADRAQLESRADIRIHCGEIADFRDTAALVSLMDRVVAVDTSIAHLAGALGTDTLLLLPFTPDWRWGLGSDTSHWYPAARLVRQAAAGDWDGVLARVADDLRQLASGQLASSQRRDG